MSYLTDVYGPRLTGSPNVKKAADWTVAQMQQWGLTGVAEEPWTPCPADAASVAGRQGGGRGGNTPASCGFPRGWVNEKFYLAAVAPQAFPIPGTPTGWTPGTHGLVRGDVVLLTGTTLEALQAQAGQLRDKWVLRAEAPDVPPPTGMRPAISTRKPNSMPLRIPAHPPEFGLTALRPPRPRRGARRPRRRGGHPADRHAVRRPRRARTGRAVLT